MSNWKIEYDNLSGKIITDEPTDESCWLYAHIGDWGGRGAICQTRETCIKKLLKWYRDDIEEKQKELAKLKKMIRKIEEELDND